MAHKLATLPPEVLADITRLICLHDLVALRCIGDSMLWHRLSAAGGVTELVVTSQRPTELYRSFRVVVLAFTGLSALVIDSSVATWSSASCFVQDLPPTMQSIRCRVPSHDRLFLQLDTSFCGGSPVAPTIYSPIDIGNKFPRLHTLHWLDAQAHHWRSKTLIDFCHQLPSSLSSLRIVWAGFSPSDAFLIDSVDISRLNGQPLLPFGRHELTDLVLVSQHDQSRTHALFESLLQASTITSSIEHHPLRSVTSLELSGDSETLPLLQRLHQLRVLKIISVRGRYAEMALPRTLEVLSVDETMDDYAYSEDEEIVLSSMLQQVPELLELTIMLRQSYEACTTEYLPPKLRVLKVLNRPFSVACPLPTSLISVAMILPVTTWPANPFLDLPAITHLDTDADPSLLFALPASLTSFIWRPPSSLSALSALPNSLQHLEARIFLDKDDVVHLRGLTAFCPESISDRIRERVFPHIKKEHFVLHVAFTSTLDMEIYKTSLLDDMQEIREWNDERWSPLPTAFDWNRTWPKSLTHVSNVGWHNQRVPVSALPKQLQVLKLWPGSMDFYVPYKVAPDDHDHILPQSLRQLECRCSRTTVMATNEAGYRGLVDILYPVLSSAPLLQILHLHCSEYARYLFVCLPPTITDLSISAMEQAKAYDMPGVKEFVASDLPHLRRLRILGWWFPIRCLLSRTCQLESLQLQRILVHGDVFPAFEDLSIQTLDDSVLYHHLSRNLLPPHLRWTTSKYRIEWQKVPPTHLPPTLTSLPRVVARETPRDLLKHHVDIHAFAMQETMILPCTLTHLGYDLQRCGVERVHTLMAALPSSLLLLWLHLPPCELNPIIALMPPSLLQLTIKQYSAEGGQFGMQGLPPRLQFFAYDLLPSPTTDHTPIAFYQLLPKSLTSLYLAGQLKPRAEELPTIRQLLPRLQRFYLDRTLYLDDLISLRP